MAIKACVAASPGDGSLTCSYRGCHSSSSKGGSFLQLRRGSIGAPSLNRAIKYGIAGAARVVIVPKAQAAAARSSGIGELNSPIRSATSAGIFSCDSNTGAVCGAGALLELGEEGATDS